MSQIIGEKPRSGRIVFGYFTGTKDGIFFTFFLGTFQKLLRGFFPLRGGGGYPLFPLRVFGQYDFPLRGGGGDPPIAAD